MEMLQSSEYFDECKRGKMGQLRLDNMNSVSDTATQSN